MKFSSWRIAFSAAVSLLLLFGLVTFGLAVQSWRRINELSLTGTTFPYTHVLEDQQGALMYKPEHLVMGPTQALVASGVITTISALIACIGIFTNNNSPRLRTIFTVITCFGCGSVITTLASLIYTMTQEQHNSTFEYFDSHTSRGHYTLESWFCQIKDQPIGPKQDTFATSCRDLTAARFLTIPLFLISLGITGSAAVTAYRRFL